MARCDLAIVGAGLAGGLLALALAARRPDLKVMLIDGADSAGGNHIWSFFDSDIDDAGHALLRPLVTHRWDQGHEVRFPAYARRLDTPYNSITSARFDAHLRTILKSNLILGTAVTDLSPTQVMLANGRRIKARSVIDARGFFPEYATNRGTSETDRHFLACDPTAYLPAGRYSVDDPASSDAGSFLSACAEIGLRCGWQKFVGQTLRLTAPHGLSRPVIMDATVDQADGFRFVYLLPLTQDILFIEDTYYTDGPELDPGTIRARIADYVRERGWAIAAVDHEESGALPVVKGGDFDRLWPEGDAVARAGVRAGLFHPTTGYSLPMATALALRIADTEMIDGMALARKTRAWAAEYWRKGGYYRLLDTMLFDAAAPAARYRIFERFYRLPAPLITRFYAGRSSAGDKIRILCGRPPVPIRAAMQAIWKRKGGRA